MNKQDKHMTTETTTVSLTQFNKLVSDFCLDLTRTFPEYKDKWQQWETTELPEQELLHLLGYMAQVFPERFFDVLYQNEEVFQSGSTVNVCFLPGVDFRELFSLNISTSTKQTLWRYLQLLLFQIMEEVKNKTAFGETANVFEGMKEEELQEKLQDTFTKLQEFFAKSASTEGEPTSTEGEQPQTGGASAFAGMQMEKVQEHLKKLMEGRIGSLVKELMDDLKGDLEGFKDDFERLDGSAPPNMGDVMKKLMRDPGKMMNVFKKVSDKVKTHMTPENREEYLKETMNMMNDMGGKEEFMRMFDQMRQGMRGGPTPGGAPPSGPNGVNNLVMSLDKNAAIKERMRRNLQKKEAEESLHKRADGSQVFKVEGQEQPKTSKEEIERLMKEFGLEEEVNQKKVKKSNKKA